MAHCHPDSVVSGVYYVKVPPGAGSIVFDDEDRCVGARAAEQADGRAAGVRTEVDVTAKFASHKAIAGRVRGRIVDLHIVAL